MYSPSQISYIGHATVLIELDGVRLLTDPLLRNQVMHLRRWRILSRPVVQPRLDAVLISHLHFDHLDLPSLRLLDRSIPVIVPRGAGVILDRLNFRRIYEVSAGEVVQVGAVRVRATIARHSGERHPFGPVADALGYLVEGSKTVYFAGDTDLFPEMASLADRLDAALLPVWGWGPTLGAGHLDPWRAAQALTLLRPALAVPIHWGTFYPVGMGWANPRFLQDPPYEFAHYALRLAPDVRVRIVAPGHNIPLNIPGLARQPLDLGYKSYANAVAR
ncbi:MAG: MBL fold metallo-hydrolase [Chloroflexi bacterium]|nr:MAG: MBL fold metallo-hydrolase [Chloroflexota bacterium]